MFKEPKETKYAGKGLLKKKYLACINGPILYTAPHSKRLYRGGPEYGEKVRVHEREMFVAYLAAYFANSSGNSFCVWGKAGVMNEEDIDPNYMLQKQFVTSSFHQCLHLWGWINKDRPILHVDMHGKRDRKGNCHVDVGLQSMAVYWGEDLSRRIAAEFNACNYIFEGITFGQHLCIFETDPQLNGYWGGEVHTMTEQAILLGIPSLQLEIPKAVRTKLFRDQVFSRKFNDVLLSLYKTVIVPWTNNAKVPRLCKEIADSFTPTVPAGKEEEEVVKQLQEFESKESLNLNGKHF